jgi:hypothetical protein
MNICCLTEWISSLPAAHYLSGNVPKGYVCLCEQIVSIFDHIRSIIGRIADMVGQEKRTPAAPWTENPAAIMGMTSLPRDATSSSGILSRINPELDRSLVAGKSNVVGTAFPLRSGIFNVLGSTVGASSSSKNASYFSCRLLTTSVVRSILNGTPISAEGGGGALQVRFRCDSHAVGRSNRQCSKPSGSPNRLQMLSAESWIRGDQ